MGEWKDIESAPKDAWVQVAKPGEYLGIAKWNPYEPYCEWGDATHWMPLPEPPEGEQ